MAGPRTRAGFNAAPVYGPPARRPGCWPEQHRAGLRTVDRRSISCSALPGQQGISGTHKGRREEREADGQRRDVAVARLCHRRGIHHHDQREGHDGLPQRLHFYC